MSEVSFLPPFISARGMLKPLCVLLVITAAVSWTSVGVDWALLSLADEVRSGLEVSRGDRLAHTKTADLLGNIQLACVLLTGGLFMAWLYQVRVNARALGCRRLRWRREWTIVGFLIPFLNALRPYQVMREVWKASDPDTADPLEWRKQRVPHILTLWWIAFVAFGGSPSVS